MCEPGRCAKRRRCWGTPRSRDNALGCFVLAFCSAGSTCVLQVLLSSSSADYNLWRPHEAVTTECGRSAALGEEVIFSGCILLGNSRPTRSADQPVRGRRHNCIAERVVATADALAAALSIDLDPLK